MIKGRLRRTRVRAATVLRYVFRRPLAGRDFLRSMIGAAPGGRDQLTAGERVDALRADAILRRLGVRCLWRSAIVVEQLRTRGVAANVAISVSTSDPKRAHAECVVGDVPLRAAGRDSVRLR
jgi:hypothetical protein